MNNPQGRTIKQGDRVLFHPDRGKPRKGVVVDNNTSRLGLIGVLLDGDPFEVRLNVRKLKLVRSKGGSHMASDAKALRKRARALGIADYEEMSKSELAAAVAEAEAEENEDEDEIEEVDELDLDLDDLEEEDEDEEEEEEVPEAKATSKKSAKKTSKAAPKKAAAKKSTRKASASTRASSNGAGDNPFRPGTNQYLITEALKEGGKRSELVKKIHRQMTFRPKSDKTKEQQIGTVNSRIDLVCRLLGQQGWEVEREGRDPNGRIKVTPA